MSRGRSRKPRTPTETGVRASWPEQTEIQIRTLLARLATRVHIAQREEVDRDKGATALRDDPTDTTN